MGSVLADRAGRRVHEEGGDREHERGKHDLDPHRAAQARDLLLVGRFVPLVVPLLRGVVANPGDQPTSPPGWVRSVGRRDAPRPDQHVLGVARDLVVLVGREGPEAAVHDLAGEGGGDDEQREHDQLGDEELSVVGALQRAEAADLAPRLVRAGDDEGDHRAEGEGGEARDHLPHLHDVAARQHHDRQQDESTDPARHGRHVEDVGRDGEAGLDPGAGVPGETGGEPRCRSRRGARTASMACRAGAPPRAAGRAVAGAGPRAAATRGGPATRARSGCRACRGRPSGRRGRRAERRRRRSPRARCPGAW